MRKEKRREENEGGNTEHTVYKVTGYRVNPDLRVDL